MTRVTLNIDHLPDGKVNITADITSEEGVTAAQLVEIGVYGLIETAYGMMITFYASV